MRQRNSEPNGDGVIRRDSSQSMSLEAIQDLEEWLGCLQTEETLKELWATFVAVLVFLVYFVAEPH